MSEDASIVLVPGVGLAGALKSIALFVEKLGAASVGEAARIMNAKEKLKGATPEARWLYFCGICWKQIRAAEGADQAYEEVIPEALSHYLEQLPSNQLMLEVSAFIYAALEARANAQGSIRHLRMVQVMRLVATQIVADPVGAVALKFVESILAPVEDDDLPW